MNAARAPIPLRPPVADDDEPLYLAPARVAYLLSVSRSEVYRLMTDHGLPSVKIAGVRRIPTEAFHRWRSQFQVRH